MADICSKDWCQNQGLIKLEDDLIYFYTNFAVNQIIDLLLFKINGVTDILDCEYFGQSIWNT